LGADVGRAFDMVMPLGDVPLLHGHDAQLDRLTIHRAVEARTDAGHGNRQIAQRIQTTGFTLKWL
jgi:hypothetical protein